MKFTQTQTATITLGPKIAIGEFEGHVTHAKPGNYSVYTIQRETGSEETALLFVHEDNMQDINELLPTLDIDVYCGIDAGTYGIVTKHEGDTSSSNWTDRWFGNRERTDGYVTHTNYGDGQFTVYTNKDHSVFLLDDEDIYLQSLLADHRIDYDKDLKHVDWYSFTGDEIRVDYYVPVDQDVAELNILKHPVDVNLRTIINIVNALVNAAHLIHSNH